MAKRHWLRRALGLGVLAGAAYALWRAVEANRAEHPRSWEPQPFPFPPQPRVTPHAPEPDSFVAAFDANAVVDAAAVGPGVPVEPKSWVASDAGDCPASHPVKAKLSSRIFHVPGGQSYDRTLADRCYVDRASAEAEGFRAAKR